MPPKRPLRKLRAQLTLAFLLGFPGIALAIGLPVLLLIGQQASSHAELLLNQAVVASRSFMQRERADLQSLALLISQRPTLMRLLNEQNVPALETYLDTLRQSVGLDWVLVCSATQEISGAGNRFPSTDLCQEAAQSGYVVLTDDNALYLYANGSVASVGQDSYQVIIGKRAASILNDLQKETGLLYLLMRGNQIVLSSEPSLTLTPDLARGLLQKAHERESGSLSQRAFLINQRHYLLADSELDAALSLHMISALNVDEQLTVQHRLRSSLILSLFLIVLIASALGVWLSNRISEPIVRLAEASAEFRQGKLDSPFSIQSPVWEIDQLANTLEDGRVALRHSLQQLQAEKAWIEHLLNSIIEGMLTLDNSNRITFASAGIGKITDTEPHDILGRQIDEIFLPLDGDVHFSSQLPATGQQRRISVKLRNGQERLLSISKSQLVPPEARSADRALVIRDVSNEEYIHRLLGDFMANITHEFRTPLAALEASSELLLDNVHTLSKSELEELLVSLNLGIINLQTLIDNLIEAASIEAGRFKVSLQPVPFYGILTEAVDMVRPLAEKYSLRLVTQPVEGQTIVLADQRRTVQALVNLLSNAVKHSPENGSIQIKHSLQNQQLRVEVIDEGSGVPLGQRGNLFRRFAHFDTENERARQGAGLGLSVVKEIVEAQQGEVGITELAEGGTSFWFTVPLANGRGPA